MKIKDFPKWFNYTNYVIYENRFLFLLAGQPVKFSSDEWKLKHRVMFYDPIEDKQFGNTCSYLPNIKEIDSIGKVMYDSGFRYNDYAIASDENVSLSIYIKNLRYFDPKGNSDFSCSVGFDVLNNKFFYYSNDLLNVIIVENNTSNLIYQKDLLIYCNNWYNEENDNLDLDYSHDISILRKVNPLLDNLSPSQIILYQIGFSDPKTLDVGFDVHRVHKHPTEPLIIVCNEHEYAVIDLEV